MLKEIVTKEIVSLISAIVKNRLKKLNIKIATDDKKIRQSLFGHITMVKNWSGEITFKDLKASKKTIKVFIPLNLYVYPRRIRIQEDEEIKMVPLLDVILREENHIAILGQPGAGKTTSMKHVCQSIFFDEDFKSEFKYPVLIKLREFNHNRRRNSAGIIIEYLFNLFALKIEAIKVEDFPEINQISRLKENLVIEILEKLKVLLIIEGFDELAFKSHRAIIMDEINILSNRMEDSKIIMTSRTADYGYNIENVSVYEICPLNDIQIKDFVFKWLGKSNASNFLEEVKNTPYKDTSIRPLTIAHLCAIYERIGKIPEKPKTVYKKIVSLLIEEWDEQRRVQRNSKYAMFEVDRKFEFLSNLAYHLTIQNNKSVFSKKDLINTYNKIYVDFDLDIKDAYDVINDVESHTGLFVRSGFEFFEFAHKSLQEYLSAEYIVKLPLIIEDKRLVERLPNELAITISISSNPSQYFTELVQKVFLEKNISTQFIQKFINRLIIEKPEFYKNSRVGINALLLYSKYLQDHIEDKTQLSLFNSDILIDGFEELINNIFRRNFNGEILKVYKISDEFETTDQTSIYLLTKKNRTNTQFINSIELVKLPDYIYCRKTFII